MASVILHSFRQIGETGKVKLFKSYRPDYGDGMQSRDFVYVKDICKVFAFMLEHPQVSGLFNLGTGSARPFNDLVSATFAAMDRPVNVEYVEMPETLRPKYQYYTKAEMGKLRAAGYTEPFYSLEEGAADYVKNYLAKGDLVY